MSGLAISDFAENYQALDFRFVEAYNVNVPSMQSSIRPTVWTSVSSPDVIRFSPSHYALVSKIKALLGGLELYRIPMSYNREAGFYELPAEKSRIFFQAIQQLQESGSNVCILNRLFHNLLSSLQEKQYITASEAGSIEAAIKTSMTLQEYQNETIELRDASRAISLAHYYRNTQNARALYWLHCAALYLQDKGGVLQQYVDLQEFLKELNVVSDLELFHPGGEELAEAAAKCPSITQIFFDDDYINYDQKSAQGIGKFLKESTSIKQVTLKGSKNGKDLTSDSIAPIADALRSNTSIVKLDLARTKIQDAGVLQIVQAIESNTQSVLSVLNFYSCGMTDASAKDLLRLVKQREHIRFVNIGANSRISKSLCDEFEHLFRVREIEKRVQVVL